MTRAHIFLSAAFLVAVYWALFTDAIYDGHLFIIGALVAGAVMRGRRRA